MLIKNPAKQAEEHGAEISFHKTADCQQYKQDHNFQCITAGISAALLPGLGDFPVFQPVDGMLHCQNPYAGYAWYIYQGLRQNADNRKQKSAKMILADEKAYCKADKKAADADKKKYKGHTEQKKAGQPDQESALQVLPNGFQKNRVMVDWLVFRALKKCLQIPAEGRALRIIHCPCRKGSGSDTG